MILNQLEPQLDKLLHTARRWVSRSIPIPPFIPEIHIKSLTYIRSKAAEAQEKGAPLSKIMDVYHDQYDLLMKPLELSLLKALSEQPLPPAEMLAMADVNPSSMIDYTILNHLEQFSQQLSNRLSAHSSNPFWHMAMEILITEQLSLCLKWLDPNGLKGTPDLLGILVCSLYYRHIAATVFDVKDLSSV